MIDSGAIRALFAQWPNDIFCLHTFKIVIVEFLIVELAFSLCPLSTWFSPPQTLMQVSDFAPFFFFLTSLYLISPHIFKIFVWCCVWIYRSRWLSYTCIQTCNMWLKGLFILNMDDSFSVYKILIDACCMLNVVQRECMALALSVENGMIHRDSLTTHGPWMYSSWMFQSE